MRTILLALAGLLTATTASATTFDDLQCYGCVGPHDIAANAVRQKHIAANAVTTPKIKDGAVTDGKLADGAVTNAKLADDAVSGSKLMDGSVSYEKLGEDVQGLIETSLSQRRGKLLDATGAFVGDIADVQVVPVEQDNVLVWVDMGHDTVLISIHGSGNKRYSAPKKRNIYFEAKDCVGIPFIKTDSDAVFSFSDFEVTPDGRVWKVLPDTVETRYYLSKYDAYGGDRCENGSSTESTSLGEEIGDMSQFVQPFKVVYE